MMALFNAIRGSVGFVLVALILIRSTVATAEESVIHTVYAASPLPDAGLQLRWNRSSEGWISQNNFKYYDFRAGCVSLLGHQQMVALQEMVRRGILTQEQANNYVGLGGDLAPQQISFFEHDFNERIKATLWSVSGQDHVGKLFYRSLPWMLEPKWKELASGIDRSRYRFLWEWGRASQVDEGDIDTLLDFATQKAFRELRTLGGKVEDAYIMIHAITPVHTLSYLRRFPGTKISTNAVRDGDSILMVPLAQVLNSHPLSRSSALIREVQAIVGDPRMTDVVTVDLIEVFREFLWLEGTWSGARQISGHPLLVQDFSPWGYNTVYAKLKGLGISPEKSNAVIGRLMSMNMTKRLQRMNRYVDAIETPGASTLTHAAKATEISGLDPLQLAQDPTYVAQVLFAVAGMRVNQVREIFPQVNIRGIWEQLIQMNAPIAMVTRDPTMSAAIQLLKPVKVEHWTTDAAADVPEEIRKALGDDWGTTTDVHYFSYGRILQITLENPILNTLFGKSVSRLSRGTHYTEYLLADPDLY